MTAKKKSKTKTKTPKQPAFQHMTIHPCNALVRDWEGKDKLNEKLTNAIWRMRGLDHDGAPRSNMGGTWHSKDTIFQDTGPSGKELQGMFQEAMLEWGGLHGLKKGQELKMRINGWAMLYGDRGYSTVHTHPNCHVSAVYYVDSTMETQEQEGAKRAVRAGDIEFVDRLASQISVKGMNFQSSAVISFKKGRMIVFPSDLPHFVHPIRGPGERISIACNGTFLLKESK